jgi:GNAT superfamily N-acetyltransferase
MRWDGPGGYFASDDDALVNLARVHAWMSAESYWAAGRSYGVMARAVQNSLNIGLYMADGDQVGFARWVTDYATFGWLCDVFIDSGHRGHGLGTFLVRIATDHPAVRDLRQVLATTPERTLYRREGFVDLVNPERWQERPPQASAR